MRHCKRCNRDLHLDRFPWRNKEQGTRGHVCLECMRIYNRSHYQRNKPVYSSNAKRNREKKSDFVREAKNVPCADCGAKYDYWIMDFDHLRDKEFLLSGQTRNRSLEKIKQEIAKCDVVCSNCHRDRTHRRLLDSA